MGASHSFKRLRIRAQHCEHQATSSAARRKGSTLQWLGDVSADAEGEPPSKKMKLAGPSEDDSQK